MVQGGGKACVRPKARLMDAAIDIAARISGATTDVAARVTDAIRDAAKATGAGFEYLLNTAMRESNLNPDAKAKSSSATGLFQFIDQTWLGTMKQSGTALGYGKYADAISKTASGRYVVNDPAMREQIFALRKDPTANSLMAGAFANSNSKVLTERLGRKPTDGELYMAHFLGASGAARFIRAAEANPNARAAGYFPRAAQANQAIFYDRQGAAKSLKQVYAALVTKHNVMSPAQIASLKSPDGAKSADSANATTAVASAAAPAMPLAFFQDIPASTGASSASAVSAAPAVAAINAATASGPASASSAATSAPLFAEATTSRRSGGAMFESLYQGDEGAPVGSVVRELWGARRTSAVETPQAVAPAGESAAASAPSVNAPLDLSRFMRRSG
jgi:hypothetical protein